MHAIPLHVSGIEWDRLTTEIRHVSIVEVHFVVFNYCKEWITQLHPLYI